jgi:hypothetical protein
MTVSLSEPGRPGWPIADSVLGEHSTSLTNVQSPSRNQAALAAFRTNEARVLTAVVFFSTIPPTSKKCHRLFNPVQPVAVLPCDTFISSLESTAISRGCKSDIGSVAEESQTLFNPVKPVVVLTSVF